MKTQIQLFREMASFNDHMADLYLLGLICVPLCRPTADGNCSASWHPRPCANAGKAALLQGYPAFAHTPPDRQWLRHQFMRCWPCNAGLVVPARSCVVEADSPEAEAEIAELAGEQIHIANVRERRPGRGRGYLFHTPQLETFKTTIRAGRSAKIDLLAPGSIFVFPPSLHSSGHVYSWLEGRAPWEARGAELPSALAALIAPRLEAPVSRAHNELLSPKLTTRVQMLVDQRKQIGRLWRGEGKKYGDTSSSGVDFAFAIELLRQRVPFDEVVQAVACRPGAHRHTIEYAHRTTVAADQELGRPR